jgi:hypothetical protein
VQSSEEMRDNVNMYETCAKMFLPKRKEKSSNSRNNYNTTIIIVIALIIVCNIFRFENNSCSNRLGLDRTISAHEWSSLFHKLNYIYYCIYKFVFIDVLVT